MSTLAVIGYIGPGPGLSMIGALIGLIVTIVSAIGAVLLWPLRKMMNSKGGDEESDDESASQEDGEASADESTEASGSDDTSESGDAADSGDDGDDDDETSDDA